MLQNKLKITISLILLTLFCGVSVFSQNNSIRYELELCNKVDGQISQEKKFDFNLKHTDIRGFLNYITVKTGVTFVVDQSIGNLPTSISVKKITWKNALNSILKANELGLKANCPVFRVANQKVLEAEELNGKNFDEPLLYTEFIRLKNVPSCPNKKNTCYGFRIGYIKLIDSLKIYLSRKGTIEFDRRSKTLIITDIKEKIASFRQSIDTFDYPEMYKITEADFEDNKKFQEYIESEKNCGYAGCNSR